jgi:Zn-dependent protease with chaperone function
MKMHLYGLANALQNAVAPSAPNQLTDWEKKALSGLRAQGYRIASPQYDSKLLAMTGEVAKKFNLKEHPKVIVYRQEYPNAAMLTYSNTMFVSTSILEILNKEEMEAVIGHELGHRRQQGSLLAAGIASTLVGLVGSNYLTAKIRNGIDHVFNEKIPSLLTNPKAKTFSQNTGRFLTKAPLLVTIGFGIVSGLIGTGISFLTASFRRHMEMDADKQSAEVVKKPLALISALEKLQKRAREIHGKVIPATDPDQVAAPIPPNPIEPKTDYQKWRDKQLSSHPDFTTREKQLRDMADKQRGQLGHA